MLLRSQAWGSLGCGIIVRVAGNRREIAGSAQRDRALILRGHVGTSLKVLSVTHRASLYRTAPGAARILKMDIEPPHTR